MRLLNCGVRLGYRCLGAHSSTQARSPSLHCSGNGHCQCAGCWWRSRLLRHGEIAAGQWPSRLRGVRSVSRALTTVIGADAASSRTNVSLAAGSLREVSPRRKWITTGTADTAEARTRSPPVFRGDLAATVSWRCITAAFLLPAPCSLRRIFAE